MVSRPGLGSDPPFGSDRELRCDIISLLKLYLNLGRDLSKMPTIAVGFLILFHKLEDPVSLEYKGLTNYLYFSHSSQDPSIFLSQYFIPIS